MLYYFFVYILIPLFNSSIWLLDRLLSVLDRTVKRRQRTRGRMWALCAGAAVLSTVKIKVPPWTHRPNRKTYRPMPIFEKFQISADISALPIYQPCRYIGRPQIFMYCQGLCQLKFSKLGIIYRIHSSWSIWVFRYIGKFKKGQYFTKNLKYCWNLWTDILSWQFSTYKHSNCLLIPRIFYCNVQK